MLLLILIMYLVIGKKSQCQNGGVPIMVRPRVQPYVIQYMCLCPFNYYGDTCGDLRKIYCRFSNQKVLKYSPKQTSKADLQFQFQCFLQKIPQPKNDQNQIINNFYKLPITQQQIKRQLKENNYYIDKQYQIVWANTSTIFDQNGLLIKNITDFRTDQEILDQFPHNQFQYKGEFLGIPLFNEQIEYNLNVNFMRKNSLIFQLDNIQWKDERTLQNGTRKIGKFSKNIQKSWEEFLVARIELIMSMSYGIEPKRIYHRIGMNSAKWRLFDPNFSKGTIIQSTTNKVPSSLLVILAFLFLFGSISGGRLAIKYYKKWKNKKNIKQMDDQNELNDNEEYENDVQNKK